MPGGTSDTKDATAALRSELSDLQGRLYAEGRAGGSRRVLVVLQGVDTSGKGGAVNVVPADRTWYRNFALSSLLLDTLRGLDLRWPQPELDLEGMRAALHGT